MPNVCKVKTLQKLAPECQKKKLQKRDINVQKEVCAKIVTVNLQNKSTRKNWHVKSAKRHCQNLALCQTWILQQPCGMRRALSE